VTAPISGRIGLRQVDPGNIVHASDTTGLVIITQLQPISLLFTIPEDNLPQVLKKLRAGASLKIDAYNRDKTEVLGTCRLLTVDNSIDATTGNAKLKAGCDNANNALFPNQFVNARLLVDTLTNQVIIPEVAVQQGTNGPFVYIVGDDSKVRVQAVTVGVIEGSDAQVLSGVKEGDAMVTDGTDKLQAGSRVRVRELGGPAGAPGKGKGKGKKGPAPKADAAQGSSEAPQTASGVTAGNTGDHPNGKGKGKKGPPQ